MVLRRTSLDPSQPSSGSHSSPAGTMNPHGAAGQAPPPTSDLAGLHIGPSTHTEAPPELSDHEDSNSDWDASEREDEGEDAPKPSVPQIHYPNPPGQPVAHSQPLPPLNVSLAKPNEELTLSPWADADALQSATSVKSSNNPFRRPTDYRPSEKANKHASVWNALGDDYGAQPPAPAPAPNGSEAQPLDKGWTAAEAEGPSQPQTQHSPPLIDLDPSNPWGDGPKAPDKGKGKLQTSNMEQSNPWDDEQGSAPRKYAPPPGPPPGVPKAEPQNQAAPPPPPSVEDQRNEIYQVKRIRWFDPRSKKNPRESPILTQNANGPCPLLALVNALSLSTPPDVSTELIISLRTREQVSLSLLLDAVIDELMSGRRGVTELPDVGDLYNFLVTLHTGMNVNPMFVKARDSQASFTEVQDGIGTFESTKEMQLYSTFAIPLIHGWVPDQNEDVFAAFARTAPSYEDAQNVHFREEEIEQKLGTSSITDEEQNVLSDLAAMKQFFMKWPTQLTDFGLTSIRQNLKAGSISILFRNDHFSTLYKEPKSGQLMSLATDAGYAGHDEIVWESLSDISGTMSEMFSGDFRSVSHHGHDAQDAGEWTTVKNKQGKAPNGTRPGPAPAAQSAGQASHHRTQSEQEDRDLALALQLQEEEEQRHRSSQAARRRENELSHRYLSTDAPEQRPQIPPRRNNRPSTNRPGEEDPELPSYEQAAATRPFRPPQGHPSSEFAPQTPQSGQNAQSGAYWQQTGSAGARPVRQRGRSSVNNTPFDNSRRTHSEYDSFEDRREGCVLM